MSGAQFHLSIEQVGSQCAGWVETVPELDGLSGKLDLWTCESYSEHRHPLLWIGLSLCIAQTR